MKRRTITVQDRIQMLLLREEGKTLEEINSITGISLSTISRYTRKKKEFLPHIVNFMASEKLLQDLAKFQRKRRDLKNQSVAIRYLLTTKLEEELNEKI